eukprot:TRINITY_DN47743_c0_g1_i1.p1 TRINITY_DN47743_c0_g1~~TRINITY_DN47743_c0_g1_i1.p1  ORF type:complete len:123 (-),score=12.19 TRINITY_DN47743_c0_g1_i1:8-376(-)
MDAFAFGALNGALSVGMGAFGAHALKNRFKDYPVADREYYQDVWKTASAYHLAHSLAICIAPQFSKYFGWGPMSAKLFAAGITLFSGSLYALVLTEEKKYGAVTPVGGLCLIAGWVALAFRK